MKGAFSLFFFISVLNSFAQEIFWKGKELQSGDYKTIDGEIIIRNTEDTIKASKAKLFNKPKKIILQGNLSLVQKGVLVTGDSGIFFPVQKLARIIGNAVINTEEGILKSNAFDYNMLSKILSSSTFTQGTANGIKFKADKSLIFPGTKNIKLIGRAEWENDTIRGVADTIYLDKANNTLKMSRKSKIIFKKNNDEISGRLIEIDLQSNKISKIEGSTVKRKDIIIKANKTEQKGEDYELNGDVEVKSIDSAIVSFGQMAFIKKAGMAMKGKTVTRIRDKAKNELFIHAPFLDTKREKDTSEQYSFYKNTNLRGQFDGYGDSLSVIKRKNLKEIYLINNAHIQNDSMYVEADTIEIFEDSLGQIIKAKRNAMMMMITKPNRVNSITAAFIKLTKTDSLSEMYAIGDSESFLWNDEKSNVGINHTISPFQKARIFNKKISRVTTKGVTQSNFQPINKVDYSFINTAALKIKESYSMDTLQPGLTPIKNFLRNSRR